MKFNAPPGWPTPPDDWHPPTGWKPDPSWPELPDGWQLWIPGDEPAPGIVADRDAAAIVPPTDSALSVSGSHPVDDGSHATVAAVAPQGRHSTERTDELLAQIATLKSQLAARDDGNLIELNDQRVLQDVGIYRYHHPLENASDYTARLAEVNTRIDEMIKERQAVLASDIFTFNGSLARGRRMVSDLSKLMLRAYNAEADNCVRSLRSGNIATAERRLTSAMAAIEKLGVVMEMRINPDFHQLRVNELQLVADYQMKRQEEKERAREEREMLREQRKVEAELAAERERLDKERAHYQRALDQLCANGDQHAIGELQQRLSEIDKAIEANDYRTANIRAGYVYMISNIGSFGPGIVKIGMTRRLEPMDRVRELGDASVPFRYDVHVLHFSDDAVTLETKLHQYFAERRVNFVNQRREFFFVTPAEVRDVLTEKTGGMLEYTDTPEAAEYFQSVGLWSAAHATPGPNGPA